MGVIVDGVCLVCKRPTDEHERDVMWGEWDCPKWEDGDYQKEENVYEPTKQERWTAIVETALGRTGRMLSGSKSNYSASHPKSIVYFNGNIYDQEGVKLWYGDIDLRKDAAKLAQIAHLLGESIYVTAESPFRWATQTKESLEEATKHEHAVARRIDP